MAKRLSVCQLNGYIKGMFDDELLLHGVELCGEVSQVSKRNNTTYITLREDKQIINCAHFDKDDSVEVGENVVLSGTPVYLKNRAQLVFRYDKLWREGEGEYYARLSKLKEKLLKEGLFDDANKPKLPRYVFCAGIVTSGQGAAVHDFIRVVHEKAPFVKILVYSAKVQGEAAEQEIIKGIEVFNKNCPDIIVVARGGGAENDLSCFNGEQLSRAVFSSRVPVISAVGHEIDYTLCDYCASMRAGTPSMAGEAVAARALNAFADLEELTIRATAAIQKKLEDGKYRAKSLINEMAYKSKVRISHCRKGVLNAVCAAHEILSFKVQAGKNRTLSLAQSGYNALERSTDLYRRKLTGRIELLNAQNPLNLLSKGYSRVTKRGMTVSSAAELWAGDEVSIQFIDGEKVAKIL